MKHISNIISVVFHPMLIMSYALLILLLINPYLFAVQDDKLKGLLLFSVATLSLLFPLFATLMMKGIGLIDSLQMKDKKERIGPMIVAVIFYVWLYLNFKNNSFVPDAFRFFILGSTISLAIAFVINTHSKISLHTVGMGGLLMGFLLIRYNYSYETFVLELFGRAYMLQTNIVLLVLMIAAGAVGSARLYLKAHSNDEVFGGYLVGMVSMLLAFRIVVGI